MNAIKTDWIGASTPFGEAAVDPSIGNIRHLRFVDQERSLTPLHTAPWVDEADTHASLPPVEAQLSGDFFCAPFGSSDIEDAPPHGWSANSPWTPTKTAADQISMVLNRRVIGAKLEKHLRLSERAPVPYQDCLLYTSDAAVQSRGFLRGAR